MNNHNITYLTDISLITCVVQSGFSEVIFKAALSVGATVGATSFHARGIGIRERLGLLGIAVEADKEVVTIMASSEQRDLVFDTIYHAAGLDVPGRGFIYITPLEKASTYIPKSVIDRIDKNEPGEKQA